MEKTMCLRCGEMVRIDCVCKCRLNTSGPGVDHSERLAGQAPTGSETRQTVYEQLGQEVGKLTDHKQAAYGDSFGKAGQVMRILYPDGIQPDRYDDALAMVRVVDKLFRVATDKDAFGESPWRDIAGYGLLGSARCQK